MIEKMMPGAESQAAEFTHLVVTMMVLLLMIVTTHTDMMRIRKGTSCGNGRAGGRRQNSAQE